MINLVDSIWQYQESDTNKCRELGAIKKITFFCGFPQAADSKHIYFHIFLFIFISSIMYEQWNCIKLYVNESFKFAALK